MMRDLAKEAVLWLISKGLRPPSSLTDKVGELVSLRKLLLQLRIDCVLDVGANRGQFATELRRIGYTGRIISFEPVASEFDILQRRFARDKNWYGHNMALGSSEETKTINVPRLSVMSSILQPIQKSADYRTETIQIRRLDRLFPSLCGDMIAPRVFLKMDTPGLRSRSVPGCRTLPATIARAPE